MNIALKAPDYVHVHYMLGPRLSYSLRQYQDEFPMSGTGGIDLRTDRAFLGYRYGACRQKMCTFNTQFSYSTPGHRCGREVLTVTLEM